MRSLAHRDDPFASAIIMIWHTLAVTLMSTSCIRYMCARGHGRGSGKRGVPQSRPRMLLSLQKFVTVEHRGTATRPQLPPWKQHVCLWTWGVVRGAGHTPEQAEDATAPAEVCDWGTQRCCDKAQAPSLETSCTLVGVGVVRGARHTPEQPEAATVHPQTVLVQQKTSHALLPPALHVPARRCHRLHGAAAPQPLRSPSPTENPLGPCCLWKV